MKTKNGFLAAGFAIGFAAIVLISSCNKSANNNNGGDNATELNDVAAGPENIGDNIFNNVFDNVMGVNAEIGIGGGIGVFLTQQNNNQETASPAGQNPPGIDPCFTVSIVPEDPFIFPKTVTLNFGDGCTGEDGKTRKGKIITVYSGPMVVPGSHAVTEFDGYYIDSFHIEGRTEIENISTSSQSIYRVKVTDGKITMPSESYIVYNRNRIMTQVEGNGTDGFPLDDIFSIKGSGQGHSKIDGVEFEWTNEIVEPLIRKFTCPWIVKGILKFNDSLGEGNINYGDGECNATAVLTRNGESRIIILWR